MVTVTELNRAPDGTFESLEATDSFTDPAGISYDGAINPVQVTEEASTFTESGVTVTHNKTIVANNSIELGNVVGVVDDFEDGDITTKSTDWNGWTGGTSNFSAQQSTVISGAYSGELTSSDESVNVSTTRNSDTTGELQFDVIVEATGGGGSLGYSDDVRVDISTVGGTSVGRLRVDDDTNDIEWRSTDETVLSSWSGGTTYSVVMEFNFTNDTVDISINGADKGAYNLDNSVSGFGTVQLINDTRDSGSTRSVFIDNIKTTTGPASSGDVTVEWDSAIPADIKAYDLATFQETLDGETVTVDVEDGSGTVLFNDIGQNFDISTVDTSKEVKLRANLSRTNTSNNPTVDYLARRFNRS